MQPTITSRQNARVRELRAALAGRGDADVVAVESPHLLREALAADVDVRTVFVRAGRENVLRDLPGHVEGVVLSDDVFGSVAATEHSQGVAALVKRPEWKFAAERERLLLVLDGVQDPGNVGTLVRSAEAFGAAAVLVTEGTADAWNGKAMRASAGAVFRVPVVRWTDALGLALRGVEVRFVAAVAKGEGARGVEDVGLVGGRAVVVGNEGKGVSAAMLEFADERVTLPMLGRTESLNAAVAGSVLLYEAARQRAAFAARRGR